MKEVRIIPVILAGGAGSRLAPLSTPDKPKQFLPLGLSGNPLLLETAQRLQACADAAPEEIHIVTLEKYGPDVQGLLPGCPLILEKEKRNTGPAIALAVYELLKTYDENTIIWICPSDHTIERPELLKQKLDDARAAVQNGHIVTFGISPTHAETGYGYIKAAPDGHIEQFTEKPDAETAQTYIQNGYAWNSGMFVATLETLQSEFDQHTPDLLTTDQNIPFDKAVMEKTGKGFLIPCPDLGWRDVGLFQQIETMEQKYLTLPSRP